MTFTLRRIMRALTACASVLLTAGLLLAASSAPAHAASPEFCDNPQGTLWCLNDTSNGGFGTTVQAWTSGATNEDFVQEHTGRCGGDVTLTCPFANSTFNNRYLGYAIVQIEYQPQLNAHLCVATDQYGSAILGTCNTNSQANNGSLGTLFIDHLGYMISLYWSNHDQYGSNASCMDSDQFDGGRIALNVDTVPGPNGPGCYIWGNPN